jgi:hypothetical protein
MSSFFNLYFYSLPYSYIVDLYAHTLILPKLYYANIANDKSEH